MRVYLAAPYQSRDQIKTYGQELERIGFTVTSSWLDEKHDINEGTTGAATELSTQEVATHAAADLADIDRSQLLVLFTEAAVGHRGGGGRHVETGYAIAKTIPVLVVGEPENVFHRLGRVAAVVPDWHEAVIELSSRLVRARRDIPMASTA